MQTLIMSLCRSSLISVFLFLIPTLVLKLNVVAKKEIIQDLPTQSDFAHYLNVLEKLVDFCTRHKSYIDLNMKFGLFIMDVNLRELSRQKQKSIPASIQSRLEKLFETNDMLSDHYSSKVLKNETEENIKMGLLFYNATSWRRPPDTFNLDLLNTTELYNERQLENIYGTWEEYIDKVNNPGTRADEPVECMESLTQIEHLYLNDESQLDCMATPHCKHLIQEGEDFGYVLAYRTIYMMFARFYRRCNVFSEIEDKYMIDQFCVKSFYEAEYIALNEFKAADLMNELITSCSVFGHAQFLRNDWIKRVLVFQSKEGCFSNDVKIGDGTRKREKKREEERRSREREDKSQEKIERQLTILHGECDGHFTATAAATLSSALRYIMETYF